MNGAGHAACIALPRHATPRHATPRLAVQMAQLLIQAGAKVNFRLPDSTARNFLCGVCHHSTIKPEAEWAGLREVKCLECQVGARTSTHQPPAGVRKAVSSRFLRSSQALRADGVCLRVVGHARTRARMVVTGHAGAAGPCTHRPRGARDYQYPYRDYQYPDRDYQYPYRDYQYPDRDYQYPYRDYQYPYRDYQYPDRDYQYPYRDYQHPYRAACAFPTSAPDSAAPLGHTRSLCAAYRQEFTVPAGYHAGRVQAVRFRYKTALRMERRLCTWQ